MKHGAIGYYETAAQVIPVIVLAIVVEYRIFGGGKTPGDWWATGRALKPDEKVSVGTSLFVVAFSAVFVLAESAALSASFDHKPSAFDDFIVGLALQIGFLMLLFVPTQPYVEDLLDRIGPLRRWKLWVWRRTGVIPKRPQRDEPERQPAPPPES